MIRKLFGLAFCAMLLSCVGKTVKSSITFLSVEEYAEALKSDTTACLIDVRTPEEYNAGHIDGARLLNVMDEETFLAGIDSLLPEHTYYIYCRSGRRSQNAAMHMTQRGLKVVDLQGGYNAWKESGSKAGE